MALPFGPRRPLTSTEKAAERIRRMLEQEELEEAGMRMLRAENWRAPTKGNQTSLSDQDVFGDGRDVLAALVQRELDQRTARRTEAQRRLAEREAPFRPGSAAVHPMQDAPPKDVVRSIFSDIVQPASLTQPGLGLTLPRRLSLTRVQSLVDV